MFRKKVTVSNTPMTPELQQHIEDAAKQPFFAKTVLCIIYAMFDGLPLEIARRKVKVSKLKFDHSGKTYIIVMKGRAKVRKTPWYSLGVQYYAELEYLEGQPLPLTRIVSDLKVDAEGIQRVTSKASRDHLLGETNSMLMLMAFLLVIVVLISLGLNGYMLTVPGGAENLRTALKPQGQLQQQNIAPADVLLPMVIR